MSVVTVHSEGYGTVLPSCIEARSATEPTLLSFLPAPGHRVGRVEVDGKEVPARPSLALPPSSDGCEVRVSFVRSCIGRVAGHTLTSAASGIEVSGVIQRVSPGSATLSVSLCNASNMLAVRLGLDGDCHAYLSTDDLEAGRRVEGTKAHGQLLEDGLPFRLWVKGASAIIGTGEGYRTESEFSLFAGDGAMLSEGWVLSIDGSSADSEGYPYDIKDLQVTADRKDRIISHERRTAASFPRRGGYSLTL